MVDKGFLVDEEFASIGVSMNRPTFLSGSKQFSERDCEMTTSIAAQRVHIERAIEKAKRFHIFDRAIPLAMAGSVNQIWSVCVSLVNRQSPIINQ